MDSSVTATLSNSLTCLGAASIWLFLFEANETMKTFDACSGLRTKGAGNSYHLQIPLRSMEIRWHRNNPALISPEV